MDRYAARDEERWVQEPPKSGHRTAFQRDRARVLHSSALRRLGAKTQVLGANSDDFVRTRLTHSLEVAQVGRELGAELGCDPDVVDTACLAHDLGHPPFGHNGESILDEVSKPIGGFEGNAQTLRLVTRLETKVLADGHSAGLNLTRASLDAIAKYPWRKTGGPDAFSSKYGVYDEDVPVFDWMREGAMHREKCLEAQVMDISDDIAYSVHDVEDAIVGGRLDLGRLVSASERAAALATVKSWYASDVPIERLDAALTRLQHTPYWVDEFDGSYRSTAALKDMTSQLIGRFCHGPTLATRERYGPGPLVRFDGDLIVPQETADEIAVLKGINANYVMASEEQQPVYERQRELLSELIDGLWATGERYLDPLYRELFGEAESEQQAQRVALDQVASLTDVSAYLWHSEICF